MKAFYCDHFVLPLPLGHRFPMSKYQLLRERIANEKLTVDLVEPPAATDAELLAAHTSEYLSKMVEGRLSAQEQRVLGFPWSLEMVERGRRSTGATLAACRVAMKEGASANLAGGTHHAFANRGEGFCCFNDIAVSVRALQHESPDSRYLVIDLDVHQGNGTAAILRGDSKTFTVSVHGRKNYPVRKEQSDVDIEVDDGTTDDEYLNAVERALGSCSDFPADMLIYQAGADIYAGDRLGRLSVSKLGCLERDRRVVAFARSRGIPIVAVMGGGYCPQIEETVDIHYSTISTLASYHSELSI